MRSLERFGDFCYHYFPVIAALFVVAVIFIAGINAPATVTLDAKHWECTMAVPAGIETRCTEYNYKGK